MSRNFNVLEAVDKVAILLYLLLVCFGVMNIYGASVTEDQTSFFDISYRSGMQMMWIGVSWTVALIILFSDSNIFNTIAYLLYGFIIIVLILTVFIAPDIKGSHSWLPLGPFSIQPAEFSKFITALALAKVMGHPHFRLASMRSYAIVCAMILAPMLIIIMQNETGSALVYASFVLMLYREGLPGLIPLLGVCAVALFVIVIRFSAMPLFGVEGAPVGLFCAMVLLYVVFLCFLRYYRSEKNLVNWFMAVPAAVALPLIPIHIWLVKINFVYVGFAFVVIAAIAMLVLAMMRWRRTYLLLGLFLLLGAGYSFSAGYMFDSALRPHQQMRIKVLLGMADDPTGISYNTNQARIAIGSGGLWGKGFLQGTQTKLKYVPEQDTDFIFCTVGEEWGFLGCVGLLLVYLFFLYRLIYIAERQDTAFVRVYAYCVVGIFAFHLAINVGMVLGLVPVIGIPLPFFSYGGSSFLSFTILLFILLKLDTKRIERTR